ncbi:hyccin-like [Pecten maximus]|uniref:hyccin-like n=1 Tax=Pecten maximus TaxID=6579 RepID=UPI0014585539|nr:hyccin-like [Pecten maximus]
MALPRAVREWLSEYKALSADELPSYVSTVRQNEELVTSLYCLFDSLPSLESLEPVYHQLFEFYRSRESGLKRFTLEFVPTLIWLYLSSLSINGKKGSTGLEAFLLAVYNLEIVDSDGKPKVKSFRIPTFGQSSVYHEPVSLGSLALTESVLSRYNQTEAKIWQSGPFPQYEAINSQNRQGILAYLIQCYNVDVASLSPVSHQMMCKACSRIATTGFTNLHQLEEDEGQPLASFRIGEERSKGKRRSQVGELPPRIPVSPALLVEMLSGIYFIMYNGQTSPGIKAAVDIHHRACYELYADVLLVTNAIRNSLQCNAAGHSDGPMGISMSLTPATSGHTISKSAITNASFRARKLPEDISIPTTEEGVKLQTIEEDGDSHKPVLKSSKSGKLSAAFGKKGEKFKLKDSKKEGETTRQNGDSVDNVQVNVVKNSSRSIVDTIEMQKYSTHEDLDEKISGGGGGSSILQMAKLKTTSALGLTKELKNKHSRNPSSSSVNTENYSTDL